MRQPPTTASATYPRKLIALHWLTALCVALAAAFILLRDQLDGRAVRMWLLEGHRHFGLFVLGLFFVRLVVRLRAGRVHADVSTPWALRAAAAANHAALYALLLAQPLLGWALTSASGKPVHLFGLTLPALVAEDEDLADALSIWHLYVAWALLALVCLHVAAALWHHFVVRDGLLRRMWPKHGR